MEFTLIICNSFLKKETTSNKAKINSSMKISTKLDTVIPPPKTVINENTDASQCKKNKMFTQKELIDTLKPKKDSPISSDKKRLPLKQVRLH